MRAMVTPRFGGPETFEAEDLPDPEPGPGEVLVRVRATSVNPVDYKIRSHGGFGVEAPAVLGWDVAGTVEATGPGVERFREGDDVFYSAPIGPPGTYAELHVAPEGVLARKPAGLSMEEAASLPLAGQTAWDGLVTHGRLGVAQSVLVHGGGGGVGTLAVQIAAVAGARVFTTCGDYDAELVRSLGADTVIDYHTHDFAEVVRDATEGAGVEVVFDTVGGDTLAKSIPVVKPHGRLVGIAGASGELGAAAGKNAPIHLMMMLRSAEKMERLAALVERGRLRPVVDRVMPLADVADAHRALEDDTRHIQGKIVLRV